MSNRVNKQQNKVEQLSRWVKYFYLGVPNEKLSEELRRVLHVNIFISISVFVIVPFAVNSLFMGYEVLSFLELSIAALNTYLHFYVRRTHNYRVAGMFVMYPLYCLMIYLVYTGGVSGAGHVWVFSLPVLTLFIRGLEKGVIELGLFTICLVYVLFFADNYFLENGFDPLLRSRLIISFLIVTLIASVYEYSMSRYTYELRETTKKLKLLAYVDVLTELLNRRGMLKSLEEDGSERIRLILADVDFFKSINDTYGHEVGDYCLKTVAEIIRQSIPQNALAARWGGEEFLVSISGGNDQDAFELAELIREKIEGYQFTFQNHQFNLTLSFGIASMEFPTHFREAIKLADTRLYKAKDLGRNQTCIL